jgi:cell division transport system ATP-binding protein
VIEFEEVGVDCGRKTVLRDITLTLGPGSLTMLVGPSGAGKSTLLRLCYRDLEPTEGRIRFFGKPAASGRNAIAALRRAVGVLPQDCGFIEHLTAIENVALPLRANGVAPGEREPDLRALLEWVDLGDRTDARPSELSRSERQRLALARAVILSPEVLVADEPAAGVDRESAERLLGLLVELNRMGKTVLVASHDRALARSVASRARARVLLLEGGRLAATEAAA